MNTLLRQAGATALVLLLLAGPTLAEAERPMQPFEMARTLQMLQDEVARGNAPAHAVQQKLVARMTEVFLALDGDVWKEPRNMRAALVYGLSGGNPRVLRTLVERGYVPDDYLTLARGALAYVEGSYGEAAKLLDGVDARRLDPSIAGHVALVQSALVGDDQPKRAIPFLNLARLLMPGTLVEEAALRRQCMIVAGDGDLEGFERLARQYLDRFGRSLYARSFRHQFATTVVRLDYSSGPGRLSQLRDAIDRLELAEQRELYLQISRLAVAAGSLGIARFASAEAGRVSEPGSAEERRARLYAASVGVVGEDFEHSYETLHQIDAGALDATDRRLLESALALAAEIRKTPEPHAAAEEPPDRQPVQDVAQDDSPVAQRARGLIDQTGVLLRQATP